ncbi:MAG: cation transporter [Candidatus Handelsmanbacteria bacterium]|nr:cation transporter [Candidatus Handelsmanbacteria bacterium]
MVRVAAVAFAAFSLRFSLKPAGFEGAMIAIDAVFIIVSAVGKWMAGLHLERLGEGTLIVSGAGLINGGMGWYLVRLGKRQGSLILEANGRHVLTDFYTSAGVIAGLYLTLGTG